jgi:hypothetical protein
LVQIFPMLFVILGSSSAVVQNLVKTAIFSSDNVPHAHTSPLAMWMQFWIMFGLAIGTMPISLAPTFVTHIKCMAFKWLRFHTQASYPCLANRLQRHEIWSIGLKIFALLKPAALLQHGLRRLVTS